VNILDALAGNYDSEAFEGPAFIKNEIVFGYDPVALDAGRSVSRGLYHWEVRVDGAVLHQTVRTL